MVWMRVVLCGVLALWGVACERSAPAEVAAPVAPVAPRELGAQAPEAAMRDMAEAEAPGVDEGALFAQELRLACDAAKPEQELRRELERRLKSQRALKLFEALWALEPAARSAQLKAAAAEAGGLPCPLADEWGAPSVAQPTGASSSDKGMASKTRAVVKEARVLSKAQVQDVANQHHAETWRCYSVLARDDASLAGRVEMSFEVSPRGAVTHVRVKSSALPAQVGSCLSSVIKRWRFPAPGAKAVGSYSFLFRTMMN